MFTHFAVGIFMFDVLAYSMYNFSLAFVLCINLTVHWIWCQSNNFSWQYHCYALFL